MSFQGNFIFGLCRNDKNWSQLPWKGVILLCVQQKIKKGNSIKKSPEVIS